jgi:hypothetical protein
MGTAFGYASGGVMAEGYYKAVCAILSELGYEYWKNAKGSHEKWQSTETKRSSSFLAIFKADIRQMRS